MACSDIFSEKRFLKEHYKKIPHHYKQIILPGRQCPFCDEVFKVKKSIRNLFLHIKAEHDSESENDLFKNICDEYASYQETGKHCCDQCGKKFHTNDTLKIHVANVHGSEKIICSECGDVYKSVRGLQHHMYWKHSKAPLSCEHCGRLYMVKKRLKVHIQSVHMQIRNFKCNICDKRFIEPQHVISHKLAIHEKLKPFECLDCDFRTARYGNLNLHRNNTHKKKSMPKAEYDLIMPGKPKSI